MSLQEKQAWDQRKAMSKVVKRVLASECKGFQEIKQFLVDNKLIPSGFSDARYTACITNLMINE